MIDNLFNPKVSIVTPFPEMETYDLYCWHQAARSALCDDRVPKEINEWMEDYRDLLRRNVLTYGIKNGEQTGGCFIAEQPAGGVVAGGQDDALKYFAECRAIFKKGFLAEYISRTGINLCLHDLFSSHDVDTAFFPVFKHNRNFIELLEKRLGFQQLGAIEPQSQDERPHDRIMLAITKREWARVNARFVERLNVKAEPAVAGV